MDRRLYFSLFITIMATAMGASLVVPLLPVYAQDMGATGLELGLIFSAFALARSFILPVVGRMADQWGRRNFMIWGLLSYALVSVGFSMAGSPAQLIILRLLQGLGAAMVIPIARTFVGEMSPPGQEGRVMGHFNMSFFGGLAMGPWLGGFVKDYLGIDFAFYAMGLLALFGAALCWNSLPRGPQAEAPGARKTDTSYLALMRHRGVASLFLFRFGIIVGLGMNWTFMPLFSHNLLRLSGTQIGILISLNVVMTTLLQPFFGRLADRASRAGLTAVGGLIACFSLFGVPFCENFWQLFALNLMMGVASGVYMPPMMAMAVDLGRQTGYMTRVMSLMEMAFSIGMVFGPIMAGVIKETIGLKPIFWFGGGIGLISIFAFLMMYNRRDQAAG